MGIWHRWHWRRGFPIRKIWTFSLVGKLAMPIPKHVSTSFSTTNPKSWPSVRCGAVSYVGLSILHTHILHTQTQLTVNQTNCIFFIQSTFYFYLVISRIHISTRHLSVPCQMAGRGQKHVAPWPYAFRNPLPVRHKRIFEFSGHPSTKGQRASDHSIQNAFTVGLWTAMTYRPLMSPSRTIQLKMRCDMMYDMVPACHPLRLSWLAF